MDEVTVYIVIVVLFGGWFAIAYATARRAITKGRSGWLWGILTVFPLGPIIGPLILTTMSNSGSAASKGQLIGRTFIITFLVFSFLVRLASSLPSPNQLSSDELAACLDLSDQSDMARQAATYNEAAEMWEFPTQENADEYNSLLERYQVECSEKTYDENDLQEMQRSF